MANPFPFSASAIAARQRLLRLMGTQPPQATDQQSGPPPGLTSAPTPPGFLDPPGAGGPPEGFMPPSPSGPPPSPPPQSAPAPSGPSAADYKNQMPPPPGYTPPMPAPSAPTPDYSNQMSPPAPYGNTTNPGAPSDTSAPTSPKPNAMSYLDSPGSQAQWNSTGKTDDFGSFFNKKTSSDALTAFGAAMLKAPTFLQGLGDAATAVNSVDRENRMPSPAQIAQARLKAEMTAYGYGLRPRNMFTQSPQGLWTKDGLWNEVVNKTTGETEWQGPHGEHQPNAPAGGIPFQATGMQPNATNNVKDITDQYNAAQTAQTRIPALDRQLDLLHSGKAGIGTDAVTQMWRQFANVSGVPVGSVDPKDLSEFAKLSGQAELDAAQTQKGLGQLTEGERQIIRDAMATAGSNPDAAKTILQVARHKAQRQVEMQDAWNAESASGNTAPGAFRNWAWNWQRQYDKEHPFQFGGGTPSSHNDSAPATTNQPSGDPALRKKYGLE